MSYANSILWDILLFDILGYSAMGDREPLTEAEREALVQAANAAVQALDASMPCTDEGYYDQTGSHRPTTVIGTSDRPSERVD